MEFIDRFLKCSDCRNEFVFTAGEQLFFHEKQFRNDPKRCKLCKARRAGLGRSPNFQGASALPLSRTETRTRCSACAIETTVPFRPTQGRPVLCRSCFQMKRVPAGVAAAASLDSPGAQVAIAAAALEETFGRSATEAQASSSASSSVATMEMISETPSELLAEGEAPAELLAVAAEPARA